MNDKVSKTKTDLNKDFLFILTNLFLYTKSAQSIIAIKINHAKYANVRKKLVKIMTVVKYQRRLGQALFSLCKR